MDEVLCRHARCEIEVVRTKTKRSTMRTEGAYREYEHPCHDRLIDVAVYCYDCGGTWKFPTDGYHRWQVGVPAFIYDLASEIGVYDDNEWDMDEVID